MTPSDSSRNIERLIRSQLANLGGYSPHKSPDTIAGKAGIPVKSIIKLDANENPYGCSPRVRQALAEYEQWHIYPDAGHDSWTETYDDPKLYEWLLKHKRGNK